MRTIALGLCVALASSSLAHADSDPALEKARIHLRAGMADYDEGRYAEAAAEMEQAYALKPVPDLQYNLGQCYDRIGRLEDAAKAYEVFAAARPDSPDTPVVKKRIENLRARAKAKAEGQVDPQAPSTEKVVFKTLVVYREVPPPPGRAARAAAYGLGALGVAGLATGVAFAVLTAQASSDIEHGGNVGTAPVFGATQQAKQDAAKLYPIGTGVGFGVGAVAIGGAVGLWLYAKKVDREAQKAREREDTASRDAGSPRERNVARALVPMVTPFYARGAFGSTTGVSVAGQF